VWTERSPNKCSCRKGYFVAHGYAFDGRPEYICTFCQQTHTSGHGGYDWDTRPRNVQCEHCSYGFCTDDVRGRPCAELHANAQCPCDRQRQAVNEFNRTFGMRCRDARLPQA
jgi:hypothetical protein